MRPLFLLRWSLRDLRRRWLQVTAIALVIAIGTGVYAALGSTKAWRYQSNDASFERLAMYDLRVKAATGADAPRGDMLAVLDHLADRSVVRTAEERLVVPTQVDASTGGKTILVPGRIVGVDVAGGGPHVTRIAVDAAHGRDLTAADAGKRVAVLERNFASFHDLPVSGTLRVAGGTAVRYVGQGLAPEYLLVMTEEGGFFAQANFAVVFVPLDTAGALAGRPGRVNDLVIRLRPGADVVAAQRDVQAAFRTAAPDLAVTVMRPDDEDAYRTLYDDIEGDAKFWNIFAGLILAGAAFGAFNLASRMVEAQRREIGIGMALGSSRRQLALRPMIVGAEIALLGAGLGVVVGLLVMAAMRPVYLSMLPMPVWHTGFQPATFVRGAALGFALPFVATAWPVWRAVRVMPVDAITTTHRDSRGGLAPLLRRLRWPVSAFRRMPVGNVLRSPRRTALTALGIGAAIATLVVILGMMDAFYAAMNRNDRELLQSRPDRVAVSLDRFVTEGGDEIRAVRAAPSVGEVDPVLRVGATLRSPGHEPVDVILEATDLERSGWRPTIVEGRAPAGTAGIVIAEKAAADLGVGIGDRVTVEHPARRGDGLAMVRSVMPVAAIHPSPFRFYAYVDRSQLAAFGAEGLANQLYVFPAAGHTADQVERDLFTLDGVASVQPVATATQLVKDSLDDFTAIFRVLEGFILLLALLIAYNATSINADERARERATLFAFGLPLRRVIGLEVGEGLLIGTAGTVVGIALGLGVVQWLTENTLETTMPDMGLEVVMSAGTVAVALVLGVVAVGVAPLLTIRRLRRMDIPGTLRVIE